MTAYTRPDGVKTVGLIGAGLIGSSWAAFFLAKGFRVAAYDPDPEAGARTAAHIAALWPVMPRAGLADADVPPDRLGFQSLEAVCAKADFILENGPENVALKQDLIRRIDAACRPEVVIASSSSSLLPSDYQSSAKRPERVLAAHPFNPPALLPLVEIAGGALTEAAAVDWAMAFFAHVGKRPIRVRREVPGYVANRMTAALFREAVDLVASGIASVEDVDAAICNGPGLRWAVMGPHLLYHLGGGAGGYSHYLAHLGPSQEARWRSLKTSDLTLELREALVAGVDEEISRYGARDLEAFRDEALADILSSLARLHDKA